MEDTTLRTSPTALPAYPMRFGIGDGIAALVLFGIHLGIVRALLSVRDQERIIPAAFLAGAFAFGAAYLAFRSITVAKTTSLWRRIAVLLMFDALLLSVPLTIALTEVSNHHEPLHLTRRGTPGGKR